MFLLISTAREKDSRYPNTMLEIEYQSSNHQDVMTKLLELDDSPMESKIASMITTEGDFDEFDDPEQALKENYSIEFFIKEITF